MLSPMMGTIPNFRVLLFSHTYTYTYINTETGFQSFVSNIRVVDTYTCGVACDTASCNASPESGLKAVYTHLSRARVSTVGEREEVLGGEGVRARRKKLLDKEERDDEKKRNDDEGEGREGEVGLSRKGGKSLRRKHWGISRYVGYIENGENKGEREVKIFERRKKIRRDSGRHRIEENSASREAGKRKRRQGRD